MASQSSPSIREEYGFYYDQEGTLLFELTQDERQWVDLPLESLPTRLNVEPAEAKEYKDMLVCASLVILGNSYMSQAFVVDEFLKKTNKNVQEVQPFLDKAVAAYVKAISYYDMRTIYFSLARALFASKKRDEGKEWLRMYQAYIQPRSYTASVAGTFTRWHLREIGCESVKKLDKQVRKLLSSFFFKIRKNNSSKDQLLAE